MKEKVKEYKHSNQVMFFDPETTTYNLWSYNSMVLEVVKGQITVDARRTHTLNYDGRQSVTTSKHIGQALSFIDNEESRLVDW